MTSDEFKLAKDGDIIEWSFDNSEYNPTYLRNKTFKAPIAIIYEEEKCFGVYTEYGQDKIPYESCELVKE